jgi:small-conductance mechanosensitive channel
MDYLETIFLNETINTKGISTILIFVLIWFIKSLFIKMILGSKIIIEEKRKWVISIRNWTTVIIMVSLIVLWSSEIQTFAISIAAMAVAIAVALKELIMSFAGGLIRSFQQSFRIGDRIEVDGVRGDVIDTDLFITKILEIGPHDLTHQYTGRAVSLPNSIFLTQKVINESFMDKYVLHVFVVPLNRDENWQRAEEVMLEAANIECASFLEGARGNMNKIARKEGLDVPAVEPRVSFHLSRKNEMEMVIRIPAPARKKGNVEQKILRRFMENYLNNGK